MSTETHLHKFSNFICSLVTDSFNSSSLSETVKDLLKERIYLNGTQIAYAYIKTCCKLENGSSDPKNQIFIKALEDFSDESLKIKLQSFIGGYIK